MATGGGKTIVFSTIPERLGLTQDEKVLILAHRDELVEQARDKYLKVSPGEMVGIEKGRFQCGGMDRVAVASVQTLQGDRIEDFISRFGVPSLVITDEAHHSASASYTAIYDALGIIEGGNIVHVGVTATPKRGDKVGLDKVFDEIVYAIGIEDLVDQGYLAEIRGFRVETGTKLLKADGTAIDRVGGDFKTNQLADAVNNDQRNMLVVRAYLDLVPGQKGIIFAADIAHSKALAKCFQVADIEAVHIDGKMPLDLRRHTLAKFKRGDIRVITNAQVLTEGYDEPTVQFVGLARPTTSQGLYTQMAGRATRLLDEVQAQFTDEMTNEQRRALAAASEKPFCTIIDFCDIGKSQSLVSLPTLLGLPANFSLKGRSLTKVASAFNTLSDESLATDILQDAEMVEALEAAGEQNRTRVLLRFLRAADKNQKYIPLEMLRPRPLPDWAQETTTMVWYTVADRAFRLKLRDNNEAVHIDGNQLGDFDVALYRRGTLYRTLGRFGDVRRAITCAERFVRSDRASAVNIVDKNAGWRNRPPSVKQRGLLAKQNISIAPDATGGDVSDVISQLFGARQSRNRSRYDNRPPR